MLPFVQQHESKIKGVLSGWDRLRFRGTLRSLAYKKAMLDYLWKIQVLLKNFRDWAASLTDQVRQTTHRLAEAAGRPLRYLNCASQDKESLAREIAAADGVTQGLICVLTCIEPCNTFNIIRNAATKHLELQFGPSKCLHHYFYLQHRGFGLMHLRLQTWLPFTIYVCLNGRDWLAEQLQRAGVDYEQRDNCFVDVADVALAQRMLESQLRTNWPAVLDDLVQQWHPSHAQLFTVLPEEYYWSADQTEWATDIMFRSPEALRAIYPGLVRHAMTTFGSEDVLRFLGRCPQVRRYRSGQIQSSMATRHEGVRIKHQMNRNQVKMYDKQDTVLRVETTINHPYDMKVYRTKATAPRGRKAWRAMRKGVADLRRRAEISQASNERYLKALATVEHHQSLEMTVRDVCQPVHWQGHRVRALRPFESEDARLLNAIMRGEFAINGFRNRDLRSLLYPASDDAAQTKRQAAKVTRQLRLLRAHGLIKKVPKTHRYTLTDHGRTAITALQAAKQADTSKLLQMAA